MECRPLYVTMNLATGLKDVRLIFDMNPYVVASLLGGERHNNKQRTTAHREGGTSPRWNHTLGHFTVDVAAARAGLLTLKLKIKTERTLGDRNIGRVDVPVRVLLEQGVDGETRPMSYAVSTGGVLDFSYRFGEAFIVREGEQLPRQGVGLRDGLLIGATIAGVVSNTVVGVLDT